MSEKNNDEKKDEKKESEKKDEGEKNKDVKENKKEDEEKTKNEDKDKKEGEHKDKKEDEHKDKKEDEHKDKKEDEHKDKKKKEDDEKNTKDSKSESDSPIPRIKELKTDMDQKIVKEIEKACENIKLGEDASKIAEILYKLLEKNFPKGWCVIVGAHFYALCVHESRFCMEFEIDDFRVGIYKVYVPPNAK